MLVDIVFVFAVPYALDEPTLHAHITLSVQGGISATYSMNSIADGEPLYYENFIYITFEKTFKGYVLWYLTKSIIHIYLHW